VFDKLMRNRLVAQLQRATGLPKDPFVLLLITQIADANYPTVPAAPPIVEPVIALPEIRRLTTAFLERGAGTIGGLFHLIWGMSAREYVAHLNEAPRG
jgi:hypothetical protein